MSSLWTNKGKADLVAGGIAARTFRIMLVDTAPASAAAAADLNFVADVVADELAGTGYTRKTLANMAATEDDTNDRALLDADDPAVYSAINAGTIAGAWVYRRVAGADVDANDILWCFLDLVPDLITNGGDITLQFNAAGISTVGA